ncbi:MAG: chorismate lyase [Kangiellaceae bacterium]|jgi:chorismate--pyruvate lyase|nr:chorismate lyase [Kangiellaceae bacterium]
MSQFSWLTFTGSLTERMEAVSGERLNVEILAEGMQPVLHDERLCLESPARAWAWVREVRLSIAGVPWLMARTVIPNASMKGEVNRLRLLGNRPLGPVLFHRLKAERREIDFDYVAKARWSSVSWPSALWCRRSLFYINHAPLLLKELFLPDHPLYSE